MDERSSSNEFWADAIKRLRGKPAARYRLAQKNMPLPAAFREAAVALRAMIRERRKAGESYEELLRLLYITAAQEDFLLRTAYIEGIGPGYNVAERIPKRVWRTLEFPYEQIGYKELPLLTKTDVKWLIAAWGEPRQHRSAQDFYHDLWAKYVARTRRAMRAADRRFERQIDEILGSGRSQASGVVAEARPRGLDWQREPDRMETMAKQKLCTNCLTVAAPKRRTPGSFLIEIVLWLCFLVPGVIYSLWRVSARHFVCPACGSREIVPVDSPRAKQLLEASSPSR